MYNVQYIDIMCNCRMRWSIFRSLRNCGYLSADIFVKRLHQINWTCSKAVCQPFVEIFILVRKQTLIPVKQNRRCFMWTSLPMIVTWWLMRAKPNVFARHMNQKAPPKVSGLWRSLWSSDCTERSIGHWVVVQGWRVVDPMGRLLRSEAKGFGSCEL